MRIAVLGCVALACSSPSSPSPPRPAAPAVPAPPPVLPAAAAVPDPPPPALRNAYTFFEPIDGRRAFPCFDEPAYKVPWQLT